MNIEILNTVNLDGTPVTYQSISNSGSGDSINNQYKLIDVNSNGNISISPDAEFTGLSQVDLNVNVPQNVGGLEEISYKGDNNTYIYINTNYLKNYKVTISGEFNTSGITFTIDWGDGNIIQYSPFTNFLVDHTYINPGNYTICIINNSGWPAILGDSINLLSASTSSTSNSSPLIIYAIELGKSTRCGRHAFSGCHNLRKVIISASASYFKDNCFYGCSLLKSIIVKGSNCFEIKSASGKNPFYGTYFLEMIDFSEMEVVPTLSSSSVLSGIPSTCKIIVSDAIYDTWIASTNWSTYVSQIIKKSDWNALQ